MPHLVHHKRRHSWPYCGGNTHLRERRNLPVLRVPEPQNPLETQFLTPLVSADLLEDDAASAGIVPSKSSRPHWLWSHSKTPVSPGQHTSSLRRMIRPPLDKARSLFVLPTTTSTGQNVVISYWVPRQPSVAGTAARELSPPDRGRGLADRLMVDDRNHRRCHSEQPRSWRRPSAALWTLSEE